MCLCSRGLPHPCRSELPETKGISYGLQTVMFIILIMCSKRITSSQYVRLGVHLQLYLGYFKVELSDVSKSSEQQNNTKQTIVSGHLHFKAVWQNRFTGIYILLYDFPILFFFTVKVFLIKKKIKIALNKQFIAL